MCEIECTDPSKELSISQSAKTKLKDYLDLLALIKGEIFEYYMENLYTEMTNIKEIDYNDFPDIETIISVLNMVGDTYPLSDIKIPIDDDMRMNLMATQLKFLIPVIKNHLRPPVVDELPKEYKRVLYDLAFRINHRVKRRVLY